MHRTLLIVASALLLGMPASLAAAHAPPSAPCDAPDACVPPMDSQCGPPFPCCYVDPATGKTICCIKVGDRVVCREVSPSAECTLDPASGQVTCCFIDPATGQPVCVVLLGARTAAGALDADRRVAA